MAFAALFPIINPIGIVAEFLGLTSAMAPSERRCQAMKAATTAALLLTVFVLAGNYLLTLFDLSLAAIETAGGLLMGYVGWKMATQPPDHPRPKPGAEGSVYLFPIAFPLLAGPGALAVSLSIVTRHDSWLDFPGTILGVVAISGVALIAMWAAGPISRRLGDHGIEILVRLMGVIVLAIAAELVFHGIASHFDLGVSHQI